MIKTKTLFVVGAGASVDFGFPLGVDLASKIEETLSLLPGNGSLESELIVGAIKQRSKALNLRPEPLFNKCLEVSGRLITAKSIDSLIHNHSDDEDFVFAGKLAIAACLHVSERSSPLALPHPGGSIDLRQASNTWLAHLFDILATEIPARSPERIFDNVAFVVFNYDRCIEHYLAHALVNRFGISQDQSRSIVSTLKIVHPYGSLGKLEGNTAFGFKLEPGISPASDTILKMADGLLTFSESVHVDKNDVEQLTAWADRAVFLGFAFHPQNVELLTGTSRIKQAVATTYGMSETSRLAALGDIRSMWKCDLDLENLTPAKCEAFVLDERRYLER